MKHILMVDDVAINLKCAAEVLENDYQISMAKSGMAAMEQLHEAVPDLILLDINMPEMDGFTVFECMKAKAEYSHIPVIFLTAETNPAKEIKGRNMGAADYIHKPYDPDDLKKRVADVLAKQNEAGKGDAKALPESQNKILESAATEKKDGYFVLFSIEQYSRIRDMMGLWDTEDVTAKVLKVLREDAGEDSGYCHLGEGRFAVFLAGKFEKEQIKTIVRRLIAGVEFEVNDMIPAEYELKISVSAGVSQKPGDGQTYRQLFECADKALYFVKQSGKRSYYFYSTEDNEIKEASEDKSPIFVMQIRRLFEEKESEASDEELFEKACGILGRHLRIQKQYAQAVWIRIEGDKSEELKADRVLDKIIEGSLRKGDIAISCSPGRGLIILMNASKENGDRILDRISQKWDEFLPEATVRPVYEIKSV